MKRNITKIFAALALLVFMMPTMAGWGQTVTFTAGTDTGATSVTKSGITISMSTMNESVYKCYKSSSMTVSSTVGNITQVTLTCTAENQDKYGPGCFSLTNTQPGSYTYSSYTGTWTGSATEFSLYASLNQVRMSEIVVVVGGSAPSTYTVTYNCNGADSGCPENVTGIASGTTITLEDGPVKDGYEFAGWSDGTTTYDEGDEYEVNSNVTFTAQWTEVVSADEQWVLTSLADLTSTDVFVIVGNNGSNYAMSNNNGTSNPPAAVAVTVTGNKITSTVSANIKWTISGNATDGYTFYPNGSTTTWLYCTNTNNGVRVGTNNAKTFKMASNYLQHQGTSRYVGVYNSSDWRCYSVSNPSSHQNIGGQSFAFYKKVTGGVTAPSISANNVNIAYGDTNGSISYTINDAPTSAGSLSADINSGSTIANLQIGTITSSAVPFTCDANTEGAIRTATVTLTYTYGNNQTVTQTVTITQAAAPMTYTTIPALYAAATSTSTPVYVTFGGWVVTGVNGSQVFVTDGTNGFIIYQSEHGFEVGNTLTGTASCNLVTFNGSAELTGLTAASVTIGSGSANIANIEMAELTGVNTGALVHYENLVCSVSSYESNNNTYYNYDLSDGTTTLRVYGTLYGDFASDLEDGKIYNITGVFVQNNTVKRILPRSAADIEEVTTPVINAASTFSMAYNHTAGEIAYTITNPVQDEDLTATTAASWITSISVLSDKVTIHTTENDGQAARTATITLSYEGAEDVEVTVTQGVYTPGASTGGDYVRISSLDQLTDGSVVVIAARYDDVATHYFAMSNTIGQKIDGTEFVSQTSGTNEILASAIVNEIDDYFWIVSVTDDGYTFTNANGDVVGYGGSTNFSSSATGNNVLWNVTRQTSGETLVSNYTGFVIKNKGDESRCVAMRVTNTGKTYGAYSTANMNADTYNFFLDFFVEMASVSEYTLDIDGYGTGTGKYYLVASPVECVTPSSDNGFIQVGDGLAYDLYRFDQGQEDEWLNYKTTPFNLLSGHGYLYASKTDTQLTFTGTAYSGDGQVSLSKVSGASWEGWNLIGNPFGNTAVLKDANNANMAFYKMNGTGTEIITGTLGADIATMEGVFVVAANNGDVVTFVPSNNGKSAQLSVNVNNGTANVDRAIVRFDNGSQLPKFQLNPNNTKVYITEGDQDFAVVRSNNEGEMPVNFKASENGTYTISANAESMEMTYLHLIDNMTGADVDLLATPSYTFDARTTDYTSRFRLVFSGNSIDENTNATETFAFFNGESWSVSNQGEASLQVVDVMGRIVNTQNINGNATINLNETPGIYMLRLVNGNNVKVQKIVVR